MENVNMTAAQKALDDGTSLEDTVLGVGYALLALTEQVRLALELAPEGVQDVHAPEPVVGHQTMTAAEPENGGSAMPLPQQLARGILERQLARGDATVEWDDRGESQGARLEVAEFILARGLLTGQADVQAQWLALTFGFSSATARRILEDARSVQDADAAHEEAPVEGTLEKRIADLEAQSRTLLLAAGWRADGPPEDGPAMWNFHTPGYDVGYGWRPAGEALELIAEHSKGIRRDSMDVDAFGGREVIRAKADAILHGAGYVVENKRVDPKTVRAFVSTPAAATLSA